MNIMNCFGCWNLDGVTAVKISLSKHSQKGRLKDSFVAEIKGLAGMSQQISSFISVFSERINKYGYSTAAPKIMMEEDHDFLEDFTQNETPYYL
jgi:hypothetical protein